MGANASHHHHEPLGEYHRAVSQGQGGVGGQHKGPASHARASIRKSLRRKKKKQPVHEDKENDGPTQHQEPKVEGPSVSRERKMDRLRRSFRDSFRRKKEPHHVTEASKPHQWQTDEASVRAGTCSFPIKYLGCVEVFESRGMQVCEEALKVLRNSRRRPIRGMLYVSGDGLRVVDDDTKGLIVDQTIEKVSFCAPDRNHEKGFSYICRDGTTRRWMCHGFIAVKETGAIPQGERLSHAVGCAFAACLERKQKRDKECGVTMSFDPATSTFTRTGSFRQMTVTERLSDPQECKPMDPVPLKKVDNPHAIARPHATPLMLQRQGSFRVFNHLNQSSPFKRQLSLRLSDLPSNLERTRSMSLDNTPNNAPNNNTQPPESPQPPPRTHRNRLHSLPNAVNMTPIPEISPMVENKTGDAVSAMCQELSAGLTLLSNFNDPFSSPSESSSPSHHSSAITSSTTAFSSVATSTTAFTSVTTSSIQPPVIPTTQGVLIPSVAPIREENPWVNGQEPTAEELSEGEGWSRGEEWLSTINGTKMTNGTSNGTTNGTTNGTSTPPLGGPASTAFTRPRNPPLGQVRSVSLGGVPNTSPYPPAPPPQDPMSASWTSNGTGPAPPPLLPGDPFDAEWAALAARNANPNNPFLPNTVTKAFEVHM